MVFEAPVSLFGPDIRRAAQARPVIGWILGNTVDHVREHADAMRALVARPATA